MKTPVVILPWVITLLPSRLLLTRSFSHSLSSIYQVARLMDVMLLHPLMSTYVSASVGLAAAVDSRSSSTSKRS